MRLINQISRIPHILPLRPLQCLFTRPSFLFSLSNFPTGRGRGGSGDETIMSYGHTIYIAYCWPMQFNHQPNLFVNEEGLLPGMGKLNDFSSYSYVYMYQSGPYILQPTWTPAKIYEF